MSRTDNKIFKITMTGLFAAMSYVVFTFLQFKITLPGGDATSIHLGNAVCVLGALLLGGLYGGIGGAVGMTIGDLLDPVYVVYAPKTFILKLCIGLITGFIAHRIGGLAFNVIFDPLLGYYYKLFILGKPAASLALVWNISSTTINAVISAVASVVIYMPLRNALVRSGLYTKVC